MEENYLETLQDFCKVLKLLDKQSQRDQSQLDCVKKLRQILSNPSPPINEVIQTDVVSYLVGFLKCQDPLLLYESAWALTNLVSGTDTNPTNIVVESGAIPSLVALLQFENKKIRDQAVWALSNISANTVTQRDLILESGALPPIITLVRSVLHYPQQLDLLQLGVWTLSNLCRSKPSPDFGLIYPVFSCFSDVLEGSVDPDVIGNICWTLSDLTSTHLGRNALISTSCLPRLVETMHMPLPIYMHSFKIFGNLVSGSDAQTAAVLTTDFLQIASGHLSRSPANNLLKEICYTLSNISITSVDEVWNYNFIKTFFSYLDVKFLTIGVKTELMHALLNTIEKSNKFQIQTIVYTYNAIQRLSNILDMETDALIVDLTLSIINIILKKKTEYADLMEKNGGFDTIEDIISKGGEHSAKATRIRFRHFQTVMARRDLWKVLDGYHNELLPTVIIDLIVGFTYPSLVNP